MASTKDHSSMLIVGAGIFGTSTAYHLSRTHLSPASITVLDRGPSPSPQAASSDINKIIRADYGSPFYMELAYEALHTWASWDVLRPYYHRTGWVMLDEKKSDLAERIRKNFKNSGYPDPSSDISFDELRTRWDGILSGIDTTNYGRAYENPEAGWVDASLATAALMKEATNKGIRYETGEVVELVPSAHGLAGVKTSDGRLFTADKILLATGAWTPWLMSSLEEQLSISDSERMDKQMTAAGCCVAHFRLSPTESSHYSKMPVLIYGGGGEVMPPTASHLFKFTNAHTFQNISTHPITGREISVPPSQPQHLVPSSLQKESIELIRRRIPQILENNRQPDEWRICWDAVSPEQNQLLAQHPEPRLSYLYIAAAGSFHSWKFLPIIGKYVVNVLEGRSNGEVKDRAWMWKREFSNRGAHEKVLPRGDLKDFGGTVM